MDMITNSIAYLCVAIRSLILSRFMALYTCSSYYYYYYYVYFLLLYLTSYTTDTLCGAGCALLMQQALEYHTPSCGRSKFMMDAEVVYTSET